MGALLILLILTFVVFVLLPGMWACYGVYGLIQEWDSWSNLRSHVKGSSIAKAVFVYPAYKFGLTDSYLDANADFIQATREEAPLM
jgi:hypothetical protein